MCLSLCTCFIEFLPYFCLVTVPFFGSFCGISLSLRLSIFLYLYTVLSALIPKVLYYVVPYLSIGVLCLLVIYVPLSVIPYPVVWLYDKILWLSDPVLMVVEVVLALNFVMYFSRSCAEKIEEDEEDAWKWKLLLTFFSALCYAIVAGLISIVYNEGSNIQFWMLLLVICLSMMLAAHNMMWFSHEGIVSDVAFVTLCSIVILYTMKEETALIRTPLYRPPTWYSWQKSGSLLKVTYEIIHTSIENAHIAMSFLKRFLYPWFVVQLCVRLSSILFLIHRFVKNFGIETEETYIEEFEADDISPWKSPLVVKCSIIFMITQSTTKLLYQSSGKTSYPDWLANLLDAFWPGDILFGRILQIVVVNCFYIWRLYCADDWQWWDWFSA